MVPLTVRVGPNLKLDVGTLRRDGEALHIEPPRQPMFEQLRSYLRTVDQPAKKRLSPPAWMVGISVTALCLRWGTYLSFLWDPDKPLDPRVHNPEASLIADSEMARINIEASANLAALLTLQHEDEEAFNHLVKVAYAHLPMPWRQVKTTLDYPARIVQTSTNMAADLLKARPDSDLMGDIGKHPMRAYANILMKAFWRNDSPVEDLHAGRIAAYTLTYRRAAPTQANGVLRLVSERFGAVLGGRPPWHAETTKGGLPWSATVQGLSANWLISAPDWSLDEQCRPVHLDREQEDEGHLALRSADASPALS